MNETSNRGGRRVGAGRKKTKSRVRMMFCVDTDLAMILKQLPNMSDTVNEALRRYIKNARPISAERP